MKAYECPTCRSLSLIPTGGFLCCGQCGYAITAVALAAEQRFRQGTLKNHKSRQPTWRNMLRHYRKAYEASGVSNLSARRIANVSAYNPHGSRHRGKSRGKPHVYIQTDAIFIESDTLSPIRRSRYLDGLYSFNT
jgi:hypothetical protein